MAARSMPIEEQLNIWQDLSLLQEAFPYTEEGLIEFANFCVGKLIKGSPTINRVQEDILRWLFSGHKYRMIMAQRGQLAS